MPDVVLGREPLGTEGPIAPSEDRDRLTDAMTRAAAECGYRAVDIEQIADYAGLTADDFRRQFANKDQCLLAAFDCFLARIYDQVDEDCEEVRDWPMKVKVTIESAFGFISELEGAARVFVVDAFRIGEAGLERYRTSIDGGARRLKHGRLLYPVAADFPDAMESTLVAGVVMIASSRLLAEEADLLPGLAPEAVEMVLTPYLGSSAARRAAYS